MAVTNATLASAIEILVTSQANLAEEIATLRRDYATLASLVQAAQVTAKPKADPMPTGPARIVHADAPKGQGVRCPHIKANGKQCRQTLDASGACQYHGVAGQPKAAAKAEAAAPAPAAPRSKTPTPGGPYAFDASVTCKGTAKNGEPCGLHFVNRKGYCRNHYGQAKGRSTVAK